MEMDNVQVIIVEEDEMDVAVMMIWAVFVVVLIAL